MRLSKILFITFSITLITFNLSFSQIIPKQKKPNIILVLVDDMGWGDLGIFFQNKRKNNNDRSEPWQLTPNLDAMAKNGAMLTNHYSAAPVCAPSRASLLLGVSQGHANVRNNQFDKALEDNYTLGNVLQKAGYKTAVIGKWGLQGDNRWDKNGDKWPAHPLNRGFDYFYGYMRHSDGHEHYPKEGVYRGVKEVYENKIEVSQGLDKCFTGDLWTAAAKKWIIDQNKDKSPFFMYLAYDTPHAVLELPTQKYPKGGGIKGGLQWIGKPGQMINTASGIIDSYVYPDYLNATYDDDKNPKTTEVAWPDTYKRYATACRRVDDAIGDVLKLLKDLKIDDNTLVIFTSDNGPSIESYLPKEFIENEPTFFNSFGPFDGIKRDVLEGGIRMPTIVQWKGAIPKGNVINNPSISYDWLPTFAQIAHIVTPARTDGVSLLPVLTGKGKQSESLIYIEYENNVKTPDFEEFSPNHRLRIRNQMQQLRIGDYVGIRYDIKSANNDFEIYNVVNDPQEVKNLALDDSYKEMQLLFKERVLQVRMPDTAALRPYDKALISAINPSSLSNGIKWKTYEGQFPWVSDMSGFMPSNSGNQSNIAINDLMNNQGIIVQEGYLKVPIDGKYQFEMSASGGFLLKIHDATVIDGAYKYQNSKKKSGEILLKAGYHPIKIYYHQQNINNNSLSLQWKTAKEDWSSIPSTYIFHN